MNIEIATFVLSIVTAINSLMLLRYALRTIKLENRINRLEGKNV